MPRHPRVLAAVVGLLVVGPFALAACATPVGSASPGSGSGSSASPVATDGTGTDVEAAWLDNGLGVGIVTWGSSTCIPTAGDATFADGTLTVELVDVEGQACTRDLVPRASYVALPAGVDPASDLDIVVTGTYAGDTELDGDSTLTGVPGGMTDFAASAGWYSSDGFLLLTYGSSGCPPVLGGASAAGSEVAVTFQDPPADQVCTMDMAPRITVVEVDGDALDDDAGATAVLTGGGFDAVSVPIAGRP